MIVVKTVDIKNKKYVEIEEFDKIVKELYLKINEADFAVSVLETFVPMKSKEMVWDIIEGYDQAKMDEIVKKYAR